MTHRPSLKSDPDGWERAWQSDLERKYPAYRKRMPSMVSDLRPLAAMMMDPSGRGNAAARYKELFTLQADLTKKAAEKCATEDFEGEWKRSKPTERKRHYMAALVAVCEIPDMEDQRTYAPEVTLKAFEAGGGQGYLNILRRLVASHSANNFVHLENPLIESMLGIEPPVDTSGEQPSDPMIHLQKSFITNRTLFITLVIWNILLSFYGESETLLSLKGTKETKLTPEKVAALKKHGATSDIIAKAQQETKGNRKTAQSRCNHCSKLQIELGDVQFKSCSKCLAAGGYTRECQVADWKTGKPPHKTVCGRPEALLETHQPTDASEGHEWGPAEQGFQRSPALLHQMRMLDENPALDYVLMRPHPHPDHGVVFSDPMGRMFFLLNRKRATTSGDTRSLKMMYKQLSPNAQSLQGVGLEGLRKQLLNEYGVDVTKLA
ncbi:hypothetical protein HWV62_1432 [Athelia sp. TMB]|nr:hypothetical protein HWV62_1432 [Athelia sp. TMB]